MKPQHIIFTHIIFVLTIVMIFLFFLEMKIPSEATSRIWFLIILPFIYIMLGFYMKEDLSIKSRLFCIFGISIIGFIIWLFCFVEYINDDFEARRDRAIVPFVVVSEMVWVFYGLYNLFMVYLYFLIDLVGIKINELNKYWISIIILISNFIPSLLIWIGTKIKKIKTRGYGRA